MFIHDLRVLDTTLADLVFPWRSAVRVEQVSDGALLRYPIGRRVWAGQVAWSDRLGEFSERGGQT